jgi:hypothetical protein
MNGFICYNSSTATYLMANYSGKYLVNGQISMMTTQLQTTRFGLAINADDAETVGNCLARHDGLSYFVSSSFTCIVNLDAGDKIYLQITDIVNPPKKVDIEDVQLTALRIGN